MGILSDEQIKMEVGIDPFIDERFFKDNFGKLTGGVSSYGYDARCGRHFKVFTNVNNTIVDPKNFDPMAFRDFPDVDFCIIPPNSFALAETVEHFIIPRDVLALCVGKSTYARCGIIVNVTPLEPEWTGKVTVEISNTTPLPCKVYSNEGIMQVLFMRADKICTMSYSDKKGRYQAQKGITLPFVEKQVGPNMPLFNKDHEK